MAELKLPKAWQDWRITEELGEGAYGRVYKAEKENGGITAVSAIKVIRVPSERSELLSLRRELQSEEELRRNLKEMVDGYTNEIRAMYRLQGHSHIVSIQDHIVEELKDVPGWRIFIRMEYLQPFDDYAITHSFSREEIIRIGVSLCEALSVCAEQGILHRDVKPENLFVTENGQFKLGDFGIAKALDRTVSTYSSKGTFSYMAPEVFHGKPYDSRADLYSTGIILYKLANRNRDPFIDPEKQIITHQDREQAMSLRMQGEKLPAPADADEEMAKVILKACEFNPKDRYASPDVMMQALEGILQGTNTAAKKPAEKKIIHKITEEQKKKWLLSACLAAVLLIAGIVLLVNRTGNPAPDGSPGIQATPVPAEIEMRIQEYGGVRYILPEGFERDPDQSTEEKPLWVCGNLKIKFFVDEKEYVPSGEGDITIGGYAATYNPTKVIPNKGNPFVYATYANPVSGSNGAVYIILYGSEEERAGISEAFAEMLNNAECIPETSVLQGR